MSKLLTQKRMIITLHSPPKNRWFTMVYGRYHYSIHGGFKPMFTSLRGHRVLYVFSWPSPIPITSLWLLDQEWSPNNRWWCGPKTMVYWWLRFSHNKPWFSFFNSHRSNRLIGGTHHIYGLFLRPIIMVQYLHFRILKFPLAFVYVLIDWFLCHCPWWTML